MEVPAWDYRDARMNLYAAEWETNCEIFLQSFYIPVSWGFEQRLNVFPELELMFQVFTGVNICRGQARTCTH